jgi:hypothetical protein
MQSVMRIGLTDGVVSMDRCWRRAKPYLLLCSFSAAGNDSLTTRSGERRFEKRQGTKSRCVGHWLAASAIGTYGAKAKTVIWAGLTLTQHTDVVSLAYGEPHPE